MSIRLAGGCLNRKGTWFLDRVVLDLGRWVDVNVQVKYAPSVELYIQGPKGLWLIANVTSTTSIELPSDVVAFSDGTAGSLLFGNETLVVLINVTMNGSGEWSFKISAKLPPSHGELVSRLKFAMRIPKEFMAMNLLIGKERSHLPTPVKCATLVLRSGVKVLTWYANDAVRSPFLVELPLGKGKIILARLGPLVRSVVEGLLSYSNFLKLVTRALGILHLPGFTPTWVFKESEYMLFSYAEIDGTIDTSEYTIILYGRPVSLILSKKALKDVKYAILRSDQPLMLRANDTLVSGLSFYTALNSSEFRILGRNLSIKLAFWNGSCISLTEQGSINMIVKGNVTTLLRDSELHARGLIRFKNAYARSSFNRRFHSFLLRLITGEATNELLRVFWRDIIVKGNVRLRIVVGGGFSVASVQFNGLVNVVPPTISWNEIGSILKAWPYVLLANAIVILSLLFIKAKVKMVRCLRR